MQTAVSRCVTTSKYMHAMLLPVESRSKDTCVMLYQPSFMSVKKIKLPIHKSRAKAQALNISIFVKQFFEFI